MKPEVIVGDHQPGSPVPVAWVMTLETCGAQAAELIGERHLTDRDAPLTGLECIEVALVDDATSGRVHEQFMGIAGATDVITFDHGEIVIGVDVARRQATEYGEPELRELLRYLVHGLLHLAGHDDQRAEDRSAMEAVQEEVVAELWRSVPGG